MDELELLYRARLPEFRRAAAAIAGDEEAGRDAVQEAFAAAVRGRRTRRRRGPLEAWVWRIVVNKEIASALRISVGTVGATLNAARKTLRTALEEVRA